MIRDCLCPTGDPHGGVLTSLKMKASQVGCPLWTRGLVTPLFGFKALKATL